MIRSGSREQVCSASPYNELYIYYIQGKVGTADKLFGSNFIGNWQEEDFSFLFFSEPSEDKVQKFIEASPELLLLDQFRMTYEEWQGGRLAPFTIGSFLILPPWKGDWGEETGLSDKDGQKSEIILDPGVVFGTGTHPTTHNCLNMLEQVCSAEEIASALDLGTGTGLLALAAAKLGCRQTLALDFNFLAAKTAKRNTVLNGLENKILVLQARAEDFIGCRADIVIANIHYDVMKHLICPEAFWGKKWLILSGLLRSEARDIVFRLSQHPVSIVRQQEHEGIWHTFLVKAES
ncbi:MAG: hypothetical protein BWK80_10930 [Desulfobacteraceae bacterium IS3]|nr:MAG: hypothetical protein BWK80_10930 [Desulfobacteraceae bacterium IS3]